LFTINEDVLQNNTTIPCCEAKQIVTCQRINVNFDTIGEQSLTFPGNLTLEFDNFIAKDENCLHYGSNFTNAIITYDPVKKSLHGHLQNPVGKTFIIENCGMHGHIWKEINVQELIEHSVTGLTNAKIAIDEMASQNVLPVNNEGVDNFSLVTISVKIYYTKEFAAVTPDINGYVHQMLAETNQGYANSKIPLNIVNHCIELATIKERADPTSMIYTFAYMKSSVEELRESADAAVLLVNSMNACGIAFFNTISTGLTLSVSMKSCAVVQQVQHIPMDMDI